MKKKFMITVLLTVTMMTTSCVQKMGKTIAQNIISGEAIPESTEQETEEHEFSKDNLFSQIASGLKEEILSSETETDLVKSEISLAEDQYQETADFSEEDNAESETSNIDSTKVALKDLDVRSLSNYNKYGLARIEYKKPEGGIYKTFINKNGEAIFQSRKFAPLHDSFHDGYLQCVVGKNYYTIDTDGEITFQYPYMENSNESHYYSHASGHFGGYTVIGENISDFDSIGYRYTIYDPYGTIVEQLDTKTQIPYDGIGYCQSGVFEFEGIGYLCLNSMEWVDYSELEADRAINSSFSESEEVLVGVNYNDTEDKGRNEIELITMTADGDVRSYHTGCLASEGSMVTLNDNICVITDEDNGTVFSFNLTEKSLYELEEYKERLAMSPNGYGYKYAEGRILVYLDGTDGCKYLCAYDEKFNLIWGPLKAKNYPYHIYTDGVLIMTIEDDKGKNHSVALDIDGNQIFELDALGYSDSASHFAEGALRVEDENGTHYYIDTNGDILFDTIDFSNVKTLFAD